VATHLTRRQALLALGGLGVLAGSRPLLALAPRAAGSPGNPITELAAALRTADRDRAFGLAAEAIAGGASIGTVLGAVLRVGVEDIRPRPHGILHTAMMVHSTFALAESASEEEAWLAVLWNLDDLKTAQQGDREQSGDWSMPPRPDVRSADAAAARREFQAAMEAWDAERADRAVVALRPHVDQDALFETLWPFAARCRAFIGHKIIYAAQLDRALARLPASEAEPAARSLVQALLVDRDTEAWDANVDRVGGLALPDVPGARDPDRALDLYRALRGAKAADATTTTLDALGDGVPADDLWEALRLVASEIFHRRSGRRSRDGRDALLPVHALTMVNAMGHAARRTTDPRLARQCLLQAAGWLPRMRDWLSDAVDLRPADPPLTRLGQELDESPPDLETTLASGAPDLVAAHLGQGTTDLPRYGARLRTSLLRTAREHHQHKYMVAMLEEGALAHPELRPLVLAPAVDYLANPADDVTELHERSLRTLKQAGLR
jgi:hypothetical protein